MSIPHVPIFAKLVTNNQHFYILRIAWKRKKEKEKKEEKKHWAKGVIHMNLTIMSYFCYVFFIRYPYGHAKVTNGHHNKSHYGHFCHFGHFG